MKLGIRKRIVSLVVVLSVAITLFNVSATPTEAKTQYVAEVSIMSDGTSTGKGKSYGTHSFIYIKNISKNNLSILGLGIRPGKGVTVGTFGNRKDGKGIYLNLEGKYIREENAYQGRISLTRRITQKELNKMLGVMKASNKWSETKNCAWFATEAWNSIAPKKDKFSWSAIKNPAGLSLKIKKKKGFVYRKKVNVEVSKTYRVYKKTKKYTKGEMETGGKNKSSSF